MNLNHAHSLHRNHLNLLHLPLNGNHLHMLLNLHLPNCLLNNGLLLHDYKLLLLLPRNNLQKRSPNIGCNPWLDLKILDSRIGNRIALIIAVAIDIIRLLGSIIIITSTAIILVFGRRRRRSAALTVVAQLIRHC